MIDLRQLVLDWDVDADILIQAVASAQRIRLYQERRKPLIDSAQPADANHRLQQAHKAIAALPQRARAHLHWALAERIASGIPGLDPEQIRYVMEGENWPDLILDALSESVEPEEPDRELQWLVQAWREAGGEVREGDHYDGDLIQFLDITYQYLGETLTADAIRLRLDRIRRDPLETEG